MSAPPLANAYYSVSGLFVNVASQGQDRTYNRHHQRSYMPIKGVALANAFRCNQGAGSGATTQVVTIKPD